MPPESCQGYLFSKPVRLTRSITRAMRAFRSCAEMPMISSGSATLRSIVRHGKQGGRLEDIAVGAVFARLLAASSR